MSFKFLKPLSIDELLQYLKQYGNISKILAGGTDLVIRIRHKFFSPEYLIFVKDIKELDYIREDENNVYISSIKTHTDIIENSLVREFLPVLPVVLSYIGSPLIRNLGTLGGNVVNASPAGDGILPLYLMNSKVRLQSIDGIRQLDIKDFIKGPGKTDLKSNEFLKEFIIDKGYKDYRFYFEKVGQRNALAISIVSMAILYKLQDNIIKDFKIGFGAVYPTILVIDELKDLFIGQKLPLSDKLLKEAETIIKDKVSPIDDIRASKWYRREVAGKLIWRLKDILV